MAAEREQLVFLLNELVETCIDGQRGFLKAAENAPNSELKKLCMQSARQRGEFAAQLQEQVRHHGGEPDQSGSISGGLRRRWMDAKAAITGRDDLTILAECERGEDVALERYREAREKKLPADVREIVEAQFRQIRRVLDRFRELK